MTTSNQDFKVRMIESNDDHLYTTIYDSLSGDPFRVKTERVEYHLSCTKRRSKLEGKSLVFYGEYIPAFVKTKEEIIGSPSSGKIDRVAPISQVKAGKRRRGRRGRKK
jgi:hypothetical protein